MPPARKPGRQTVEHLLQTGVQVVFSAVLVWVGTTLNGLQTKVAALEQQMISTGAAIVEVKRDVRQAYSADDAFRDFQWRDDARRDLQLRIERLERRPNYP
jgi:hypothetical protein